MSHSFWADEFPRWYIAIFEVIFGTVMIVVPSWFTDLRRNFRREIKDTNLGQRFSAVLERRRRIEAIPMVPWRLNGGIGVAIGIATALNLLAPVLSYALFCLSIALVMTITFVRLRNQSEHRAASLTPRTSTSNIPGWVFGAAVVCAVSPLSFVAAGGSQAVPAAIVALVSTLLVIAASLVSGMAAILTGDDAQIELAVESRLRCSRVGGILILATAVPFVFFTMGTPGQATMLQNVAYVAVAVAFFANFLWFVLRWLMRAKPLERVTVL